MYNRLETLIDLELKLGQVILIFNYIDVKALVFILGFILQSLQEAFKKYPCLSPTPWDCNLIGLLCGFLKKFSKWF